jgi:hypothetical protein
MQNPATRFSTEVLTAHHRKQRRIKCHPARRG